MDSEIIISFSFDAQQEMAMIIMLINQVLLK